MKDIKIIFVDIDWTIYDHKHKRFDKRSIIALKHLQKKGIKVIISTSRPLHSVYQLGVFDLFTPDGFITMNGGYIVINNKEIYEYRFPKDKLHEICDVITSFDLTMELSTKDDRFLIKEKNDYVDLLFQTFKEEMPPVKPFTNEDVITALLFAPKKLDKKIKRLLPEGIEYFRFAEYGVDIIAKPHLKGGAVNKVLDYLKLDKSQAMAFGDDYADISMFENVQYGIALNNGKKEVKDAASFITKEVWKSGVYRALKHYHLLNLFDFCLF